MSNNATNISITVEESLLIEDPPPFLADEQGMLVCLSSEVGVQIAADVGLGAGVTDTAAVMVELFVAISVPLAPPGSGCT